MSAEGNGDRLKGKAKEAVGKVTGNDRMRAEGKADQAKGSAKNGVSAVTNGLAGIKDSLTSDSREPRS